MQFKMDNLKYQPLAHIHQDFMAKAKERPGFTDADAALDPEFVGVEQMIKARAKAGLTQDAGEFGVDTCILPTGVEIARPHQ